uniref:Uncharacterized protein n=1 Tax=Parascaris equorum TaxID=6256 RepID=A0A914R978_PAREQ
MRSKLRTSAEQSANGVKVEGVKPTYEYEQIVPIDYSLKYPTPDSDHPELNAMQDPINYTSFTGLLRVENMVLSSMR